MTYQSAAISNDLITLPQLPGWVTSARPETAGDVAFLSGAALCHLHLVLSRQDVPQTLLRARLALRAAEACVARSGRPERSADLRDAVTFLQPGDSPGPAGAVYLSWLRAVDRPVSVEALHRALPELEAERIASWLDGCNPCDGCGPRGAGQGGPVPRANTVLQAVLEERPRDHVAALILAEATIARALGWTHVLPLLSLGLKRGDLQKTGDDLLQACHRGIVAAAEEATREAADLTRRTLRLKEVAPKLRARGSEEAVTLLLTSDAVTPKSLTSLRSDRAARRFCDRLVELGAVRELTGRDTFRLYGV